MHAIMTAVGAEIGLFNILIPRTKFLTSRWNALQKAIGWAATPPAQEASLPHQPLFVFFEFVRAATADFREKYDGTLFGRYVHADAKEYLAAMPEILKAIHLLLGSPADA